MKPHPKRPKALGIDIGRVIIDGSANPDGGDTAFFSGTEVEMLATPAMPGAFDSISRLVQRFDGRVWLVSKCGPTIRDRSSRWLAHHQFFETTGMTKGNARFCRERREKRTHALKLGLTHFIDDRVDVHRAIYDIVDHCYLFGEQRGPAPDFVSHVADWPTAEAAVLATLAD